MEPDRPTLPARASAFWWLWPVCLPFHALAETPALAGPGTDPAHEVAAAPEASDFPKVIVTGTATAEDPLTVPYSVEVVGPAEFERALPRTTPEALRELPSVMLQKTGHGQGSPYLRGFTGFRTLMLVDGIRLNNSTFRDGPNQYWGTVDALSLARLELVRGPSSVLYGSDAVGGTVNAITKSRAGYDEGFDWDGGLFYRFSSAEESHVAHPEVSAQYDRRIGIHLGGSWKDFGELHAGDGVGLQPQTGYDEGDFDAKVEYHLTPQSRLVYGHQTVTLDEAWRTHSTVYGVAWSGTVPGSDLSRAFDQRRDLDYVQYHAQALSALVDELHVSVSRHFQGETETRVRSNQNQEVQDVDVTTLGLSFQLQSPSAVGRWIYGAEYYRDWVDSAYRGYNPAGDLISVRYQGPVADDATYDLVGGYVEDHFSFAQDRVALIVGGRYTYAQADANSVQHPRTGERTAISDSWDSLVGNARLGYTPDAAGHWNLYAGISQGFRAPNLSDLTRFDADAGQQEIPTPGVEPEYFLAPEFGLKARFARWTGSATYFHTFMEDVIVRVPTGETAANGNLIVTKENSGEGYVHGVELAGSVALHPDWVLWSNFTWMEGRLDTPVIAGGPLRTEPMSRIMPVTVNSGLRWEHPNRRFWAEFAATFAAQQDQLSAGDTRDTQRIPPGGTPGYAAYHLRAGWRPCRHATISVALENLTDEDYRIHGSGLNEPGRNVVVAADFKF